MENYFYINSVISLVVLALIRYGKGSNTANYYLSACAILTWFIPYQYLAQLIPAKALAEPIIVSVSQAYSVIPAVSSAQLDITLERWLMWLFCALLSAGVVLFAFRLAQSFRWKDQILSNNSLTHQGELSGKHQLPIYSVNQAENGFILGIINPVIVVSASMLSTPHLNLILAHEKQHIKSYDNARLLILMLCESLFWWNPIVRKLVSVNRFLIEARCDETTSKSYGVSHYINDLSALVLTNHHHKKSRLVCSVMSNNQNNLTRIKLLKEDRKMTVKKKLMYMLVALSTLTMISWHTIATAKNNESSQNQDVAEQKMGAMLHFDARVKYRIPEDTFEQVTDTNVIMWANFDKKVSFIINDRFKFNYKVKDLADDLASIEMEIVEMDGTNEIVVSKPKLTVKYSQEAMIEIDNGQVSPHAYAIKFTPFKAVQPEE